MQNPTRSKLIAFRLTLILSILVSVLYAGKSFVFAQANQASFEDIRTVYTAEFGVQFPTGFAYLPDSKGFALWGASTNSAEVHLISNYEQPAGTLNLSVLADNPLNAAFNVQSNSLFVLNNGTPQLIKIGLDRRGLPDTSGGNVARYDAAAYGALQPQGITFDPADGRLFILDAKGQIIVSVAPTSTKGFDGNSAAQDGRIKQLKIKGLENSSLRGIAYNPQNKHFYVAAPAQQKVYELDSNGKLASTLDLSSYGLTNIQALTFAPSADQTDDPAVQNLFVLDGGVDSTSTQTQKSGQILELSMISLSLPAGTTLLPSTLIRTFATTNAVWSPSSPDPSGIDYWPPTGGLIIDDSEVDEMSVYAGKNVYLSTRSGTLTGTCNTTTFTHEPTGMAVNPTNNHIFMTDDDAHKVFEINLGGDGIYCTSDDVVTIATTASLFGNSTDEEDIAYGANTLFISGGTDAEVYKINLGPNGVLGGGDDGPTAHFDTGVLGFQDLEGIGYNADQGTLFIISTSSGDRYLGEVSTSGSLIRAYDLALMGTAANIRSDVAYAPSSQNAAVKSIYIVSRGIDNDSGTGADPNENDGKAWEISIAPPATATPTKTATQTRTPTASATATSGPSPTNTATFTPTNTATNTATPTNTGTSTPSATFTATPTPSNNPLYLSMASNGSIGGVTFADEDILRFDGVTWSLFFDGSDVGVSALDLFAFSVVDADTLLMSFDNTVTIGTLTFGPHDIVQFDATSLGSVTAGTFSMYLNGVDVGLDTNSENIDSLELLPDGRVLISTTGNPSVVGITGGADEDILAFTPITLGDTTSGVWAMYFDGSDVDLATSSNEDIDALGVAPNGDIYLSTLGDFAVTGVSGADEDVFICIPASLGSTTACTYASTLYFDGSTWGQSANDVDAFNFLTLGPIPTNTPTNTPTITPTFTKTPTPTNTSTPTNTFTATSTSTNTPTATIGPSPTNTATFTPTNTATDTATPGPTATQTNTPTPSATSAAATLFNDGFESGDFSAWTITTVGGDGSAVVQNSVVFAGNFSAQLSETANTGSLAYTRKSLSAAETNLTISGDFMVTQEGISGGNVPIFRIFDPSGTRLLTIYRQNVTNGQIWSYDGTTRIQSSTLMPINTWTHFDLHVITNGTGASTIEVYMNGVRVIQTTTANLGTAGVLTIQIGNDTSRQAFTLYADDINIQR